MHMNRLKVKVSEECLRCAKEMYKSYKHPNIYNWLMMILDRINQNREVSLEKRKQVENIMMFWSSKIVIPCASLNT